MKISVQKVSGSFSDKTTLQRPALARIVRHVIPRKVAKVLDLHRSALTFWRKFTFEPSNTTMKTVRNYAHWFVIGMGQAISLFPLITPVSEGNEMDAMGRDFRAVGNDLRTVMRRVPATPTAARIGETAGQPDLIGLRL